MFHNSVFFPQPLLEVTAVDSIDYFTFQNETCIAAQPLPDFFELLYAEKGELSLTSGNMRFTLTCGDLLIHRPGTEDTCCSIKKTAPALIRISFSCPSSSIAFLSGQILRTEKRDRILLAQVISEARFLTAISSGPDSPFLNEPVSDPPPGCTQLIKLYLEQLLIKLLRRYNHICTSSFLQHFPSEKTFSNDLYIRILSYLTAHLHTQLTIDQICRENSIGRSQLEKLFHEKNGCGVIEFFSCLKIERAKQMIAAHNMNFSQIADTLGYSSVHYFSRRFKKLTKMTPSEYSRLTRKHSGAPSTFSSVVF